MYYFTMKVDDRDLPVRFSSAVQAMKVQRALETGTDLRVEVFLVFAPAPGDVVRTATHTVNVERVVDSGRHWKLYGPGRYHPRPGVNVPFQGPLLVRKEDHEH